MVPWDSKVPSGSRVHRSSALALLPVLAPQMHLDTVKFICNANRRGQELKPAWSHC